LGRTALFSRALRVRRGGESWQRSLRRAELSEIKLGCQAIPVRGLRWVAWIRYGFAVKLLLAATPALTQPPRRKPAWCNPMSVHKRRIFFSRLPRARDMARNFSLPSE